MRAVPGPRSILSRARKGLAQARVAVGRNRFVVAPDLFDGKSVIVVGPSQSALAECDADFVEGFDLVVRINSGLGLARHHGGRLGHRTDILAHSLYEGGERGTGEILPEALAEAGTRCVLCPLPDRERWVPFLSFHRRMARFDWVRLGVAPPQVRLTPKPEFDRLQGALGGTSPTTGLALLNHLMHSGCKHLHITGISFFTGAYAEGYKDGVEGAQATRDWGRASKHDLAREQTRFTEILKHARQSGCNVTLDQALANLVCLPAATPAHGGRA